MYESPGSQFFRTTTRLQSGLDAFDEPRLKMTFFNQLWELQKYYAVSD